MTPPSAVVSARHLPTPVQRWTAALKSPAVVAVAEGEPLAQRPGLDHPQVGVHRPRVDEHPGVEQVVRVEERLDPAEEGQRRAGVHERQQRAAGPAVAVLAGQ